MSTLHNNHGVTLVFVAMGLFLFLLFLGLALDTGWLVYVRAQGQARMDSATLAAAAALVEPIAKRPDRAKELADTFSEKNSVVNGTVNPENVVTPMTYNETTGTLTEAPSWELWGVNSPICNAVRVTTNVPTPVFFAGIRNVFGAGETGQENLTFSSVSHLPCPGIKTTDQKLARLALSRAFWNLSAGCNEETPRLQATLIETVNAALAQVDFPQLPLQADVTSITPQPFPLTLTLAALNNLLTTLGLPVCDNTAIVPVVDDVTPGIKRIKGFAAICKVLGGSEEIVVKLQCGEVAPSSAGTGECFGTYASNPILIR